MKEKLKTRMLWLKIAAVGATAGSLLLLISTQMLVSRIMRIPFGYTFIAWVLTLIWVINKWWSREKFTKQIDFEELHSDESPIESWFLKLVESLGHGNKHFALVRHESDELDITAVSLTHGGIVRFSSRIAQYITPDELKAVIAHELGHLLSLKDGLHLCRLVTATINKLLFWAGATMCISSSLFAILIDKQIGRSMISAGIITFWFGYPISVVVQAFFLRKLEEMADVWVVHLGYGEELIRGIAKVEELPAIKMQGKEIKIPRILYLFFDHPIGEGRKAQIKRLL